MQILYIYYNLFYNIIRVERCPRGRRWLIRNQLQANRLPGVRIPPSLPYKKSSAIVELFLYLGMRVMYENPKKRIPSITYLKIQTIYDYLRNLKERKIVRRAPGFESPPSLLIKKTSSEVFLIYYCFYQYYISNNFYKLSLVISSLKFISYGYQSFIDILVLFSILLSSSLIFIAGIGL